MKTNIKIYGALFLSVFIQCIFMHNGLDTVCNAPFLSVMPGYAAYISDAYIRVIGYCFILVPFFLLVFSTDMSRLTHGYGKLLIIREYSKRRMILKLIGQTIIRIFVLVSMITLIEDLLIVNKNAYTLMEEVNAVILFSLTWCVLILMQYLLEMLSSPQLASIIVNIYILTSLLLWQPLQKSMPLVTYALIPNLGYRNRSVLMGSALGIVGLLISLMGVLIILCVKKFDNIDTF